jgi:hypothetical protein
VIRLPDGGAPLGDHDDLGDDVILVATPGIVRELCAMLRELNIAAV